MFASGRADRECPDRSVVSADRLGLREVATGSQYVSLHSNAILAESPEADMKRRDFISLCGGVAFWWSRPARAQRANNVVRIGILDPAAAGTYADIHYWSAFRDQMRALGQIDGANVVYEDRWANGNFARLPALTRELVDLGVRVILARSTPAGLAARTVTSKIPIVVPLMADPVGIGLVSSLARPGGNVTGLSTISAELSVKRLELLRDFVPQLSRVAILWDETNPAFGLTVQHTEAAARAVGLSLEVVAAKEASSLSNVFAALNRERVQGLIVAIPLGTPLFGGDFARLVALAAQIKLPAVYAEKEYVTAGGLASYGPVYVDLFRRAAVYTDKILKGAVPADLPVEEPTKFETVINLKTAKTLGIEVPPLALVRADEVVE